ncbi:class I SAM-dependent methyltransferase [Streptomyces sp. NPDC048172]|uniref:class I SAM-dependent methyltransferase n=1 Tax=Streptomyces sp. NPDC048172 TaxID=3365505 RepID=UPI003715C2B6
MGLSMATAERWVRRWEAQQERYALDREERFTVIADVVEQATAGVRRPRVADLGCGPGSLAARLARRLPHAAVTAADVDALLLELGRTHHADAARFVHAEIGADGWLRNLGLEGPLDAAVSTTALHCLDAAALRRTYESLAAALRPGGVLVNSDGCDDGCDEGHGPVALLAREVGRRRAERRAPHGQEDWHAWWSAAAQDPELAPLVPSGAPGGTGVRHNGLGPDAHATLLREAGFTDAAPVWQFGTDYVLVAVR